MHPSQFLTESLRRAPWGETVANILAAAIRAVDPYRAVARHLRLEGEALTLGRKRYHLTEYENIYVVGAGKAGLPMARAAVDVLGERVTAGVVTTKTGHAQGVEKVGAVAIREAGHPLPDERGVAATREILSLLNAARETDLVVCLISGGGSALLTAPFEGLSLDDLRALIDALLARGASIGEINTLRKQLDRVKGGGLARAAAPAQVVTLILSDVVGDPLDVIASGPTVPNPDRPADALAVVRKYALGDLIPAEVLKALERRSQPAALDTAKIHNLLVGNNRIAAEAVLDAARKAGFDARLLTTELTGEARVVGRELAAALRRLALHGDPLPRPALLVAGGETTVTLRGTGTGGRNQEAALAAVAPLAGLEEVAFVALATDGGDGPTDAAGAVVTGDTLARARALGLDPAAYLADNDSYAFFSRLGDGLKTGPTQTNVNDLNFLFAFEIEHK